MAILCVFVILLSCALSTYSDPAVKKRQADQVDAMCADLVAQNSSNNYTVEISEGCTHFNQCLSDRGFTMFKCALGLFFDPTMGVCQYPNRAACATSPCHVEMDGLDEDDLEGCAYLFHCFTTPPTSFLCQRDQNFDGNVCVPDYSCAYEPPPP